MKKLKLLIFSGVFTVCLGTTSCGQKEDKVSTYCNFTDFKEGDIVFRRGTGWASQLVITADKAGRYSHIGIVVKEENNWKVIHAVPGEPDFKGDPDRIKKDDAVIFFKKERAKSGAVMRVDADSMVRINAARHALALCDRRILFDHEYDLTDTTQMYCTELIDHIFKAQGIDLVEGRINRINIPGINGKYIFPSDIQQSEKLCTIYNF